MRHSIYHVIGHQYEPPDPHPCDFCREADYCETFGIVPCPLEDDEATYDWRDLQDTKFAAMRGVC